MQRALAERIVCLAKNLDLQLGEFHDAFDRIEDETERKKMKRALGEVVLDVHEKITLEVTKQFPDLQISV
jgi:chaperonin cofactor prefoldin